MNNILIIQRHGAYTVRLVDLNLITVGWRKDINLFHRLVDQWSFKLSKNLLKDNFKLEI